MGNYIDELIKDDNIDLLVKELSIVDRILDEISQRIREILGINRPLREIIKNSNLSIEVDSVLEKITEIVDETPVIPKESLEKLKELNNNFNDTLATKRQIIDGINKIERKKGEKVLRKVVDRLPTLEEIIKGLRRRDEDMKKRLFH